MLLKVTLLTPLALLIDRYACAKSVIASCLNYSHLGVNSPISHHHSAIQYLLRAGRTRVRADVDVEILLSSRWQASPLRHCSAHHYAERRHDSDLDSCRQSYLVS